MDVNEEKARVRRLLIVDSTDGPMEDEISDAILRIAKELSLEIVHGPSPACQECGYFMCVCSK